MAKRDRSHPRLPAARDRRSSVDPRQHHSQSPLPEQPVERASEVQMIAPGHQAATSLQQRIDLCICTHTERMRTQQTIVRSRLGLWMPAISSKTLWMQAPETHRQQSQEPELRTPVV